MFKKGLMKLILKMTGGLFLLGVVSLASVFGYQYSNKLNDEQDQGKLADCIVANLSAAAKNILAKRDSLPYAQRSNNRDDVTIITTVAMSRCNEKITYRTLEADNSLSTTVMWQDVPRSLMDDPEYNAIAKPYITARRHWDAEQSASMQAEQARRDAKNRENDKRKQQTNAWMLKDGS